MSKYIDDILAVVGAGCIVYGCFLFHEVLGFMALGTAFILCAGIVSRLGKDG